MSRKESVILKCDICEKTETYTPPNAGLIKYPIAGWYFDRELIWNNNFSTPLDFCEGCFKSVFTTEAKIADRRVKAASIWKRFFGGEK